MSGTVHPLLGNQKKAVEPQDSVWLSASAGTGKTQVLSSRVLRLLLQSDVAPSQILCLTFTKAGATEMAARINETLASWVRLPDTQLYQRLEAIGAKADPATRDRARTLFAAVLDCPGGGLRIDTIHAFAQWLLGAFPHEAGLTPGTRAMEDRDRAILARQVLGDLLVDAEAAHDTRLLNALAALSIRLGPDDAEKWLLRCAEEREAWIGPRAWQAPLAARVKQLLGLAADAGEADVLALCSDEAFDMEALRCCFSAYNQWNVKTGLEGRVVIGDWLSAGLTERSASLEKLHATLFTQKDTVRSLPSLEKLEEGFAHAADAVLHCSLKVRALRGLLALAEWLTPALELGRTFALAWDAAKQREGLIDFDDQIRSAAQLLGRSELAEWIRYKLDRRFDHILIDEAQDTNAAQWSIINALTGDFFAGEGAHGDKLRTLFVVGDYKQAIFRFQGTSPENFEAAKLRVSALMRGAADNAQALRANHPVRPLQELGLDHSFRTAQPVLDFVNSAIDHVGHEAFGLTKKPEHHVGDKRPGLVTLWKPVGLKSDDDEDVEEGAEGWLSKPEREMADGIARQVRAWMDHGFPLLKGRTRRAGPGDVMVLVRKRRELAGLIVARLHAAGVPVAGVDRLRLGAPLAVRDLVAALRFAAQPLDDLHLAALLVSPLIGWTQEDLLAHAYRDKSERLWDHLRRAAHPVLEPLGALLALADFEPPAALLHWLLVGPWGGRRKLVARLGREANDPIDELLNAAHAYAAANTPSLVGFLNWFDAGDGELKREAGKSDALVRVMTVHGSKGLQAPIVILADATGNPETSRSAALDLPEAVRQADVKPITIPLPALRKEEKLGRLQAVADKAAAEEMQEHWRLLYVAMTRAEEALFIGGALGSREKEPAPASWYARLAELFPEDGKLSDEIWGYRSEWGDVPGEAPPADAAQDSAAPLALPAWLTHPLAPEPRPPRPLSPSALGEDTAADPPFPPGVMAEAARRGVLLHKLLERLPAVALAERAAAAERWLARNAAELSDMARTDIAASALAVIADPRWAEIFVPTVLAEVPVAALVGERVVAGTIDRLVILPDRLRIVDFKTSRRPPGTLEQVPVSVLRQMAAYAAALEAAYPGRVVEAALLYTQTPRLIEIPADLLARHKLALTASEESFSA
jgi:ATP-dependent helicase/nuclease subunit A